MKILYTLFLIIGFCIQAVSQVSLFPIEINDSSDNPKKYYIQLEYPNIKDFPDVNIQEKINSNINSFINKSTEDFKIDLKDWELPNTELRDMASGFYVSYEAVSSKNVFSLILYFDHYFVGTAHPSHESHTMNFNLSDGNLIKFEELFDKNKNYLSKISELCIKYLKNKNEDMPSDDDWIKNGAGPVADNFNNFNIKPECLLITFDPYQVGAYALGYQSVEILYKDIEDIVNKNGPLKEFYK